jgi:predicted transcriptional regulator YdeE
MEPRIVKVELPPRRLVGVVCLFIPSMQENSDAKEKIPEAWHQLGHVAKDNHLSAHWSIGVMSGSDEPGKMRYVACVPGDASGSVPEGMMEVDFEGGTYVGCEHIGSLDSFGQTAAWFYSDFLPSSEYHVIDGPHLEIYDERFNPESPTSVVTLCAPIAD